MSTTTATRDHAQLGSTRSAPSASGCASEFPDISISKIRYLEDQGLLQPRRTRGGYRLFSEADVERLETILRLQRDEFLPLRVIRDVARRRAARGARSGARRRCVTAAPSSTCRSSASAPASRADFARRLEEYDLVTPGIEAGERSTARATSRSPPHAVASRGTASTRGTCGRSARRPGASRRCSSSSSRPGSARATSQRRRAALDDLETLAASRPSSHSTFSSATFGRRRSDDGRRAQGTRPRRPGLPDRGDRLQGPDAADRQRGGVPIDRRPARGVGPAAHART